MAENSPQRIDTPGEVADLAVFMVVALLIGSLIGATVLTANPRLDEQLRYQVMEPPTYGGDEIVFTRSQIAHLNKAYRESYVEQGRCLEIVGDRVDELKYPLNTTSTTRNHITFDCPRETNGILHTHPGLFALPELSPTDQDTLLASDLQVSCVLSDPVPDRVTENPVSMNCFDRDMVRLRIEIVD